MRRDKLLCYSPPGFCDPTIAIAACRAGGRGVLDFEFVDDCDTAQAAIERLTRFTTTQFGIKLGRMSGPLVELLLAHWPTRLRDVILAGGEHPQQAEWIGRLKARGARVLCEAASVDEALRAEGAGADGLILKGNEAGGRVGDETAFILLQRWQRETARREGTNLPVWVHGGIGPNTAAACIAGGAAGVVLDWQLVLSRESPLASAARRVLAACDGSETVTIGQSLGESYRVFNRPGSSDVEELKNEAARIEAALESPQERLEAWRDTIRQFAHRAGHDRVLLVGQDVALAQPLAERFVTVGGIIEAIARRTEENIRKARQLQPLAPGAPLAAGHKTKYPVLQGPMTRVSDTAPFAAAVAEGGGLPFLALALLRKDETARLLKETRDLLGDRSWGVGILGFLPPEIRKEQIDAIRDNPPPFALIAGGRPDQARELEKEGIPTYLHVPSPGLLKMFLRDGARRFVFEGRECGGHVGPRSSFILWETMCEILLEHIGPNGRGDDLHVVFAGGIHDALSGAMVAALAAPLAERGASIGVLMGTAYLFTKEAVESGAIVPKFQQSALHCRQTVLLETGPGHAIRCIPTPYYQTFEAEKKRLEREGKSHEEIVRALEWMNIGRLRIASKGLDRVAEGNGPSKLATVTDVEQFERGMYMIGQVSSMRDSLTTIAELHDEVCSGGTRRLDALTSQEEEGPLVGEPAPCDIAIVGMSCFYPRAKNLGQYWENIFNKVDAVIEVPKSHWDWELFYDEDPLAPDKIVSKWGGFLGDIPFDPFTYGITPASMKVIEPLQLLLLEAVRHALDDAGYTNRPFNRERTAAVVGIGGGGSPMASAYGFRVCLPVIADVPGMTPAVERALNETKKLVPEWTEDSFPGFLMNVAVGRVANRFNFGGANFAIDAACASSLAAVQACIRELQTGAADVALAMGADTVQTPFAYMAFSKTHALSRKGRCSPFDAAADGIVLSEGIGVCILKRLADAERDGDRIFAVIKGVGASSDGKEKGLTAPNAAGQLRALRRAYAQAGISPKRAALVEGHGTGTVVGDRTEAQSLSEVLREAGAEPQSCALGSVKSMIGHSKCAAGIAGLIKTTMALHRKVLPPTLVDKPNPRVGFETSALYLNTQPRPWIHGRPEPRCAGVSAFGFGGTNLHVVLEEYTGDYLHQSPPATETWPAEVLIWRRPTREALVESITQCQKSLAGGAEPALCDLAAAVWKSNHADPAQPTLAIVASSQDDLREKLPLALQSLRGEKTAWQDPRGLYFAEDPAAHGGRVALLFPGQGSQYPDMLADVAMAFVEVREALDRAEGVLDGVLDRPLAWYIYPPSAFSEEEARQRAEALAQTHVAQPAIGAASLGMHRLLNRLGIEADFLAGHSYGEYAALCAAGGMSDDDLIRISHRRGAVINETTGKGSGTMAAVEADAEQVRAALDGLNGITLANLNSPKQTVISGADAPIDAAVAKLKQAGLRATRIAVACAFHSPLVAPAAEKLAVELGRCTFSPPRRTVFSNTTAQPYPGDPAEFAPLLAKHLAAPVRFQEEIAAMYEAGARIFIEVGPQGVLTNLVKQILGQRPHVAVASDLKGRSGLVQLGHLVAQLAVCGVPLRLERLYRDRVQREFALIELAKQTGKPDYTPSTWMVNGVRSRPVDAPEKWLVGQRHSEEQRQAILAAARGAQEEVTPIIPPLTQPTMEQNSQSSHPQSPATPQASNPNGQLEPWVGTEPSPGSDEAAQVVLGFQNLMARFLDTQRHVMLAYLQGTGDAPTALDQPAGGGQTAPTPSMPSHAASYPQAPSGNGSPTTDETPATDLTRSDRIPPQADDEAAVPAGEEPEQLDLEQLSAQLLDLVSKRTGYPLEMLDLDLDLEADLGIDSIKRVEILGTLAEGIGGSEDELADKLELEKLTSIRTLRGIIDYLEKALFSDATASAEPKSQQALTPSPAATPVAEADGQIEVQRGLVKLIDAPLPSGGSLAIPNGVVLLTDDECGVARELANRLADFGQQTALIRMRSGESGGNGEGVFSADLTDAESVSAMLSQIRQQLGAIGGLVHLMPLAEVNADESWAIRARRDVKSLYLLARALEDDLRKAAADGAALLLATTAMGGSLGFEPATLLDDFNPGHGGILGFVKCVAMEWPEVLVRAIDLDGSLSAGELVDRIAGELSDKDGPREVGYLGSRRVTWEPYQAPLDDDGEATELITAESTILVTGGARGITATIAQEIARQYQARLILVGRSPLPESEEPAETRNLYEPGELKAALIEQARREGRNVVPAEIEARYQRLLCDREIRGNLDSIRQAGSEVHYYSLDVRDGEALAGLVAELTERFGGIDGVIHGAGVIEDKLVRDKTPESFDRVFNTKVDSALALSRCLDPERLKFCVLFSSLASRYGNRGQSDYAAANEVLSKLAVDLDRRWPARVLAIAWGPWGGIGMVADLERHLTARGLKLISPETGPQFVIDELRLGRKGETEVVIAGGAERLALPTAGVAQAAT